MLRSPLGVQGRLYCKLGVVYYHASPFGEICSWGGIIPSASCGAPQPSASEADALQAPAGRGGRLAREIRREEDGWGRLGPPRGDDSSRRAQAEALSGHVNDSLWCRGRCPICGGEPDIAALERGSGQRRLLCSRCDSEWAYQRVACPFCGNENPSQLAYYPSDDKVYRLSVCERCHRYLKTVDLRETAGERLLPAERILTIGMDLAAQKAGYRGD
jgi:transcription elongation factor Elf1